MLVRSLRNFLFVGALSLSFVGPQAFAASGDSVNFRFHPVVLIVGMAAVNVDLAVGSNWTLGPELVYWNFNLKNTNSDTFEEIRIQSAGGGVRANWFKNGTFTDGLYVGPSLKYSSVKVTGTDSAGVEYEGTGSGAALVCVVGYGWFWNSFNMMLGGGASASLGKSKVKVTDSLGNEEEYNMALMSGLALEYTLGWTF